MTFGIFPGKKHAAKLVSLNATYGGAEGPRRASLLTMNVQDGDLKSLKNLGPKSAAWLRTVGIHTPDELRRAGALKAFRKIRKAGFRPSLNLLYALEGALQDVHWNRLSRDEKRQLVLSYDALEEEETSR